MGTLAERPGVLSIGWMHGGRKEGIGLAEEQEGDWLEKTRGMSFDTQGR